MQRFVRLTALSLVMVLMFTLTATAQDENVLVIAFEQEPPNLQPLNNLTFGGLTENFYARDLWGWDENRDIFPVMATEVPTQENGLVEIVDGNTIVTVQLREGMLWSDGTPITAADCEVTHTIRDNRETSDSVARAAYPELATAFEIVDDLTFTITYEGVFADYLSAVERPECTYPAHVFGPMIEDGGKLEDDPYFSGGASFDGGAITVGYGPYVMTEWNIGENMIYDANPNWDGETPAFDRIVVQYITDDTQMRNALDTGEVDVAFNWSDDLQPDYAAIEGVETFAAPGVYTDALWIRSGELGQLDTNGGVALLDPMVRQAIAHAIDRITLAEQLVGPGIAVPTSWYPAPLWPDDLPFLEYDVEGAQALLAEAGWEDTNDDGTVDKDGVELDGLRFVTTENTLRNNYQLVIQEYLAEVGIGVDIQIIPGTTLFASYADRGTLTTFEWDLAIFANSADPLSPLTDRVSYTCDSIPSEDSPDGFNGWQFCDPEYDALDEMIGETLPSPERDEMIAEAVRMKWDGLFWHGLRLRSTWFAVQTDVLDVESVEENVGTLASNWFNQVEYWEPAS